jgi:hypothetical protein
MTPQPFPLHCMNAKNEHFIVLGWTPEGKPVVVRETWTDFMGERSEPHILEGPLRYRLPEVDASIFTPGANVVEVRRTE